MVPTVDRGLREVDFWSIETAGDRPSMKSTSGLSICPGTAARRPTGLDVAALPSAKIGVEGQARLAGAGQPGEDDQGVAGQVERDVLEVVLTRAAHDEAVGHRSHRKRC
jgi:hypothetical protein